MKTTISLTAKERTLSENLKHLRKVAMVPAELYGKGAENLHLFVPAVPLEKILSSDSRNNLIDLAIEGGETVKILIADVSRHPVKRSLLHVDFHKVKMDEKITAEIQLNYVGESLAVKNLGAVLVRNLDEIKVKCFPVDLIDKIDVDISQLNTIEDIILVKDLVTPDSLEVLNNPQDVVVSVIAQREEEKFEAASVAAAATVPVAGEADVKAAEGQVGSEKSEKK